MQKYSGTDKSSKAIAALVYLKLHFRYKKDMAEANKLLVFAHKGEAATFIEHYKMKRVQSFAGELYLGEKHYLLLTGEGPAKAYVKFSRALSFFEKSETKLDNVINIGIAGSLKESVELMSFEKVSVVLGEGSSFGPEFKAIETTDKSEEIYLITALNRVKDNHYASKLSLHAELVDREAYAIANLCEEYQIPFHCYKLVSDLAGSETDCFDVKERAKEFSTRLLENYKSLHRGPEKNIDNNIQAIPLSFLKEHFHFSRSQEVLFEKLKLTLTQAKPESCKNILGLENLKGICNEEKHPKNRSRILLEEMTEELNPFIKLFAGKMAEWFGSRPGAVKNIQTDPFFEKENLRLTIDIQSNEDLESCIDFLEKLPLEDFQDFFRGRSKDFRV